MLVAGIHNPDPLSHPLASPPLPFPALPLQLCWSLAAPSVKQQVLSDMWGWGSASGTSLGLPPMRHPHQQELLDLVHAHLLESEQQGGQATLPLQIIFSTPTGSGKTFSAVMMNMHLLRPRAGITAQYGEGHRDAVVLYSVPTKQVGMGGWEGVVV